MHADTGEPQPFSGIAAAIPAAADTPAAPGCSKHPMQTALPHRTCRAPLSQRRTVQVVERALRTAACLLAGSACDAAWETYAGDAVDDALKASNKARAGAFAAAASAAAGAVLEALMARNGQLHSSSLLGALCLAHSQAVLSPECLAALCPGSSRGRTLSPVVEVGEHERAALAPCGARGLWVPAKRGGKRHA